VKKFTSIKISSIYIFIICVAFNTSLSAQYEYLTQPLTKEEVYKNYQNKVAGYSVYKKIKEGTQQFQNKLFDETGRLIIDFTYYRRTYYAYDESNGLTNYIIDSTLKLEKSINLYDLKDLPDARTPKNWKVDTITISYDFENKLEQIKWSSGANAFFRKDLKSNRIIETLQRNDSAIISYYTYDKNKRLTYKVTNIAGKKIQLFSQKTLYTNDGNIINQNTVQKFNEITDSTLSIFHYDANNKIDKRIDFFYNFVLLNDENQKPYLQREHNESTTTIFKWNKNGDIAEMRSDNSLDAKFSKYYTYDYNEKKLLTVFTQRIGKLSPTVFEMKYYYYQ